jgi:hypothetical protein
MGLKLSPHWLACGGRTNIAIMEAGAGNYPELHGEIWHWERKRKFSHHSEILISCGRSETVVLRMEVRMATSHSFACTLSLVRGTSDLSMMIRG